VTDTASIPTSVDDPVNAKILEVSEDQVQGFERDPLGAIAERSGVPVATVIERVAAMLRAGVIRRVRQTMLTTSLAPGALVAWKVPPDKLDAAFDYLFHNDPFSGHVVVRSTDAYTPGAKYRLWTTLKVPVGFSMNKHADRLAELIGAEAYKLMPAKCVFTLGVGHIRRRKLEPGARSDEPGKPMDTNVVELDDEQWRVLTALKREVEPEELSQDLWAVRAREADLPLERFYEVAEALQDMGVVGRFSTFLEHVKKSAPDARAVTRYNALFHWRVPEGMEMQAGQEVGRHHIMTHAYWREGGEDFNHVNIMGVAHGTDKDLVLAHKAAIDEHLKEAGIDVGYTAVFWGGRSEITPSEIVPAEYAKWCESVGIDPDAMRG